MTNEKWTNIKKYLKIQLFSNTPKTTVDFISEHQQKNMWNEDSDSLYILKTDPQT